MFGVEQLFTEIVKAAEGVFAPCLPKVSVGDGAQIALFPVSPLFGQRITVAPPPVVTLIVRLRLAVALCAGELESVTFTVNEDVPSPNGKPLICPELLSVNPAGKEPELRDQLYGLVPPLADSVAV
jgi:hypothetical protein